MQHTHLAHIFMHIYLDDWVWLLKIIPEIELGKKSKFYYCRRMSVL